MPPQVNATLLEVAGADPGGDWDRAPAPAGAVKWTGALDAYYSEDVRRVTAGGETTVTVARRLFVDTPALAGVDVDTDDVLTIDLGARGVARHRAVTVARRELDGIPVELQTTRLDLGEPIPAGG